VAASLDELLFSLRQMQAAGGVGITAGGAEDWYEVMLFPPAFEADIEDVQNSLGKRLPEEFLQFWRNSDGANLYLNDSGLHGVGVASTELMAELQTEEAENYGRAALSPFAVFARVNGSGDFLAFDLASGAVVDGVHAEQPHEWRPIATSFVDWLDRLVEARGRYYWLEALMETNDRGA
jgi:hypothetical protein